MSGTLQQAIAAIKAGDKAAGRRLLVKVILNDPRNEAAWLWMSAVVDSAGQRRACLERVLAINPDSSAARQGLARLGFTSQAPVRSPAGTPAKPGGTPMPGATSPARPALPGWNLLIAFGAAVAACATIGTAVYLALTGVLRVLRQLGRLAGRR